ncbi:MAG: SDR family NAD(P)-dependent oxidoreductase [Planctomycetota bacterium]|nr:SDR family NAD(P)-dependent oxidoreductase [Planctomycetota bacterium]
MIPMNLEKQVAIVTGAGRGIGRAIAMALARCRAHVMLVARTDSQLQEVAQSIRQSNGLATVMATDLGEERQIVAIFERVRQLLGRVDVLVNNAGIGIFGPLADFAAEDFDRVITTNLRGTFLCCREAMKLMMRQKSGYIINIASVVGFKGYPNQAAYTASKHGVMGLTKSLAVEAQKYGIRVSAILPGGVNTGMVPDARPDLHLHELLKPEDIVQSVLYLLSLSENAAVDQIYIRRRASTPF